MDIDLLVKILNEGELAVIPTDTVYGLIADATNEKAINKVYEAKKRDKKKPLLILVSSISMLKDYVTEINDLEMELIKEFWPGPLTIIFDNKKNLSDTLTANKKAIAIRLPNNSDLINIINKLNKPIIATSANIADKKTITNVNMLEDEMKNKLSYIYDSGTINNEASTIIKVNNNEIVFLREGILAKDIKNKFKNNIKKTFND